MYSFLQEGEFVQLDFNADGTLKGFISRYGDSDTDKGAFLDHFIKTGAWKAKDVTFQSAPVHSVWFEFKGHIQRGEGKTPAQDGYYVLKGTLTQYTVDTNKKTSGKSREITMKSFARDADTPKN